MEIVVSSQLFKFSLYVTFQVAKCSMFGLERHSGGGVLEAKFGRIAMLFYTGRLRSFHNGRVMVAW